MHFTHTLYTIKTEGSKVKYYNQETQRLSLRKMNKDDIQDWIEFFLDNPLEIYIGIDVSLPAQTKATNWIELQLKRYASNDFGHLAAIEKESGQLIGVGGLIKREVNLKEELEISYSIIPQFWGSGYATEISRQMKKYALENRLSDSLISIINVENIASKKVASKNGMKISGTTIYKGMNVDVFRAKCV
jgi:ribosomal-protein-alanine N-acetyltransferase